MFQNIPLFKVAVAYNEILTVWVVRLEVSDERHQSCSEPQSERVLHFSIFSHNHQNYCGSFFNIFTQSSKLLLYIFQYLYSIIKEIIHFWIFSIFKLIFVCFLIFSFNCQKMFMILFFNIFIQISKELNFFSIFSFNLQNNVMRFLIFSLNLQNDFIHFYRTQVRS